MTHLSIATARFLTALGASAALLLAAGWTGCGGSQPGTSGTTTGAQHATGGGSSGGGGDTGGGEPGTGEGDTGGADEADAGAPDAPAAAAAPVTFELVNTAPVELDFNTGKGWQPVIFAYSGTPGKDARPIVMFPMHCTASCDAAETERCPYCPPPANAAEERELEQRTQVMAGESVQVPWDGQIYVYEKTRGLQEGKKATCQCWRRAEPPPAEYTVKACGLRVTTKPNVPSQIQCVETKMTLPPAETPLTVRLEFPDPNAGKGKKKKGK